MSKHSIFVSCGQYTEAEKSLGKAIVEITKSITGLDAFFAEEVQDLNGLDSNILCALRDCAAFIVVLHPRGSITRPDESVHTRASVWIEQEIAIATYIQRVEKRSLPVIAFIHESVGREGLRDLLHLNPIQFKNETQVLAALPELLKPWRMLTATGISLQLQSGTRTHQDGHALRQLVVILANDTNQRISNFNCEVRLPTSILKHSSGAYPLEVKSDDQRFRRFRFDEKNPGSIPPHSNVRLIMFNYCTQCAAKDTGENSAIAAALVGESVVEAKVWIENKEYMVAKTIKELAEEAEGRGVG